MNDLESVAPLTRAEAGGSMRVAVDDDRCRGHGVCCAICPDVFVLSSDGYAVVRTPEVPSEFEEAVRDAAESCPEQAITTR